MFISVIICTIGRPELKTALNSVLLNKFRNYELIVVVQGLSDSSLKSFLGKNFVNNKRISFTFQSGYGLSRARNLGIRAARGDVLAFTDDDCLVSPNWLEEISHSLTRNRLVGVFGDTYPQNKPSPGLICPSTFIRKKTYIINKPIYHAREIGFGNNMAFKKVVFTKYGLFKEWLGIGSVGLSAEDAEFALRLLVNKEPLLHSKKLIVYHDRLLTSNVLTKQSLYYNFGEMACYGYFLFQGFAFARPIIGNDIKDSFYKIYQKPKSLSVKDLALEIFYRITGLLLGLIYSQAEPLV